jgi:thiosulfate/3-mercaptopyruvate sulfurtransferase
MSDYKRPELLAETAWLEENLSNPNLRIVDMRGYVRLKTAENGEQTSEYVGARAEYVQEHIPGAIFLDWTQDIIDPNDSVPVQVARPEQLAKVLGEAGIGDEHTIVIYDNHPASQFATRLWWVLKLYGHDNVKILNGGLAKWEKEERPLTSDVELYQPATFTPNPRPEWRATYRQVLEKIGNPAIQIIDARDEGQYKGTIRRGKRAGRIPGAVHLPREALINPDNGTFRPAAEIQELVTQAGVSPEKPVVAYCNGGVAATSVLFSLSLLGFDHLTNYDGSWNEWSEREELPVEN